MSELSEEEIARVVRQAMLSNPDGGPFRHRETERSLIASEAARLILALLQPALERARMALTDEQDHLLMCAIENLRSAERNDRTVEAAWRMAEKMEAWRKAAAIRKG